MQIVSSIAELRSIIQNWRQSKQTLAFVPTMGNLHSGHLELVNEARKRADKVVVSIFVNPTQFGPNEDFVTYPRTEQQDVVRLTSVAADLLFLPTTETMYPESSQTQISVAGLSTLHCGSHRPGHFDGVALVVCKLLNIVQPDCLLLGEKDFQQLAVIRQMVTDLNMPLEVIGIPTVREADGLAMSSRNVYLSAQERQVAPMLYQCLCLTRDAIKVSQAIGQNVLDEQAARLQQLGFAVDYFHLCRRDDLLPAGPLDKELILLAAVRLGKTRLIDNIYFDRALEDR
jgi:pantoate--beta-alanine ligase